MPLYRFMCKANHITEQQRSVTKFVEYIKCRHWVPVSVNNIGSELCGKRAVLMLPKSLHVQTFKPYVEENFTGKPIHIETQAQRDKLCKQHGVTYDSNKYHRKPKQLDPTEHVDLGMVKDTWETGVLPDGTKLDRTVVETTADD